MIQKIHASILNIHEIVGEKEALGWLQKKEKKPVSNVRLMNLPKKRATKRVSWKKSTDQTSSKKEELFVLKNILFLDQTGGGGSRGARGGSIERSVRSRIDRRERGG
jgi:hypothetical protein